MLPPNQPRRLPLSHPCRGVSPRRNIVRHTAPRSPTFATLGSHESRASQVTGRRGWISRTPERRAQ